MSKSSIRVATRAVAIALLVAAAAACGSDGGSSGPNGDAGHQSPDTSDAPEYGDHCPTDVLPSQTSVTYQGSTIGNDNLFESSRLEWDDAGDDALLYVVPETGTYELSLNEAITENGGCHISIHGQDDGRTYWTPEICPEEGAVRELPTGMVIGGEGGGDNVDLSAGQQLLVLISCTDWARPSEENDYTLTIEMQ
jgi:hypothetical protein